MTGYKPGHLPWLPRAVNCSDLRWGKKLTFSSCLSRATCVWKSHPDLRDIKCRSPEVLNREALCRGGSSTGSASPSLLHSDLPRDGLDPYVTNIELATDPSSTMRQLCYLWSAVDRQPL